LLFRWPQKKTQAILPGRQKELAAEKVESYFMDENRHD
jgi:pyridoxine/pyridoxamine 5'-phosphate oxidase